MKIRLIYFLILFASVTNVNAQWAEVNLPDNVYLRGAAFFSSTEGYVCGYSTPPDSGYYGKIWKTTDGGQSWTMNASSINHRFNDVVKSGSDNVWVTGDSGLVFRFDLLNNFYIYQNITGLSLLCGSSPDSLTFYCAGENGALFRTLDAGYHWDTLNSGTVENINDIYFTTRAQGWIVADGGYLAMTTDSGNTWTFANQPYWGFRDLNSLSYQGSTGLNPYVVGTSGSGMYSTDGGTSWYQFATNTGEVLNSVQFGTTNSGIICGANGFVSRSSNGGGNWNTDVVPRTVDYYDVSFGSDSVAYICGDSGVVLKSTVDVSGISENNYTSNLNAFPNPASEQLYLELNSEAPATFTIRILDITGKEVQSSQNTVAGGRQIVQVKNFSELANGVYFITVSNANGTATTKVVKN